jgi:FAD/FMN-containing dehydrogenase
MATETPAGLIDRFAAIVGARYVLTEPHDMEPHVIDWRGQFRGTALAVVRPANVGQVAAVVRAASELGVAIVPQSGNTGLAAGAVPSVAPAAGARPELVVSLGRMNVIRDVDPVGLTIEAEAGVILKAAQDAAAAVGRLLPVSLAAEGSAQIGGVLATNAGGINVVRYGMARQLTLGLEVVLPDGTIVEGLRRLRKDNAGYDWKQLFLGSEGTLGIITAAVLRLAPRPRERVTSLLAVDSPAAALALLARSQTELGDVVNAFELISGASLDLVERHFGLTSPAGRAPWFVLLEASASIPGLRDAAEATLAGALEAGEATDGVIAESESQAVAIWALREHITEAELKEGASVKHDVSVPVTSIPDFLADASQAVAAGFPGTRLNAFGHAGDGNIHFNVFVRPEHDRHGLNHCVHDVVARYGGSISAEHGIGQYRVGELARYKSVEELALMRRIKAALDPDDVLNPGKVLPRA